MIDRLISPIFLIIFGQVSSQGGVGINRLLYQLPWQHSYESDQQRLLHRPLMMVCIRR